MGFEYGCRTSTGDHTKDILGDETENNSGGRKKRAEQTEEIVQCARSTYDNQPNNNSPGVQTLYPVAVVLGRATGLGAATTTDSSPAAPDSCSDTELFREVRGIGFGGVISPG